MENKLNIQILRTYQEFKDSQFYDDWSHIIPDDDTFRIKTSTYGYFIVYTSDADEKKEYLINIYTRGLGYLYGDVDMWYDDECTQVHTINGRISRKDFKEETGIGVSKLIINTIHEVENEYKEDFIQRTDKLVTILRENRQVVRRILEGICEDSSQCDHDTDIELVKAIFDNGELSTYLDTASKDPLMLYETIKGFFDSDDALKKIFNTFEYKDADTNLIKLNDTLYIGKIRWVPVKFCIVLDKEKGLYGSVFGTPTIYELGNDGETFYVRKSFSEYPEGYRKKVREQYNTVKKA